MSTTTKVLIGAAVSLIILLTAGLLFLRHLVTKSFPQTIGTVSVHGLHSPVDVYRDEYGVPHIQAQDEHDLMFAAGYVQAQDRLWQMDLLRRTAEGRLSELFGTATLDYDKLFRTIGLRQLSARLTESIHPTARKVLDDYADGVNCFIDSHKGTYPIEFDMLNYEPEHWSADQSVMISRLIAWNLNFAWWTDVTYGQISERVPPEKFQQILPVYPDSVPAFYQPAPGSRTGRALLGMTSIVTAYRTQFGLGPLRAGSNAWAVDSSHSLSGKPLLANDPHLPMPQPALWYEIALSAPGWNAAGVSIPGTPLIVIGHNDRIAWGSTNAMLDDADFYAERIDSSNPGHYIFDRASRPMEYREEKILVRPADSVIMTIRSTIHGPVVSDIHPSSRPAEDSLGGDRPVISMRWTGYETSDEINAFYLLDRSTNSAEFEHGLSELNVPAQVFIYADTTGNIASWTAGRVPIRGKGNPMLPFAGWTSENDWKGFVPFSELPKRMNPPEGFVASANHKLTDRNASYYFSTLWEPAARIQRIRELLRSADKFSADDFKQFQGDVVSPYAKEITPHILSAFDTLGGDRELSDALTYLRNWDYHFSRTDIATTIFNTLLVRIMHNTYEDELGTPLFNQFVYFGAIPYRVTAQLLAADSSSWFDDIRTPEIETKTTIIRKSMRETLDKLRADAGSEMKNWQWGTLHTVTFHHPFGSRKALERVFNVGPFPCGGGGTTINNCDFALANPLQVTVGPSMRQIVDLAAPLASFSVLPTGESGQPLQQHYDDQTSLWLNGGYHRITIDRAEIAREHWQHMELRPK